VAFCLVHLKPPVVQTVTSFDAPVNQKRSTIHHFGQLMIGNDQSGLTNGRTMASLV
jgi:hypothetical protein